MNDEHEQTRSMAERVRFMLSWTGLSWLVVQLIRMMIAGKIEVFAGTGEYMVHFFLPALCLLGCFVWWLLSRQSGKTRYGSIPSLVLVLWIVGIGFLLRMLIRITLEVMAGKPIIFTDPVLFTVHLAMPLSALLIGWLVWFKSRPRVREVDSDRKKPIKMD
jgi:hypothetical protein